MLVVDFDSAARGLQFVTDETWISELGIHYKLGVDGLNLFLVVLDRACCSPPHAVGGACASGSARGCSSSGSALAETGVLGALLAQDLALFVDLLRPDAGAVLLPHRDLGHRAETASRAIVKLFIYTLVGSLLMLAAAIATGVLRAGDGADRFVLSELAPATG